MATQDYYRGGAGLKPSAGDVMIDVGTGLLRTTHGVSVWDRPDGLTRFDGAFRLGTIPPGLRVIQRGRDPHHFEVVPEWPMPMSEYEELLDKIARIAV
jgi:hypothetical protein